MDDSGISPLPPAMQINWENKPPQVVLLNPKGITIKRWTLTRLSKAEEKSLIGMFSAAELCRRSRQFLCNAERGSAAGSASVAITGQLHKGELFVASPASPQVKDMLATPRAASRLRTLKGGSVLTGRTDLRSRFGKRLDSTQREFGYVYKSSAFKANDVMNAVEIRERKRERAEKEREKLIESIEGTEK